MRSTGRRVVAARAVWGLAMTTWVAGCHRPLTSNKDGPAWTDVRPDNMSVKTFEDLMHNAVDFPRMTAHGDPTNWRADASGHTVLVTTRPETRAHDFDPTALPPKGKRGRFLARFVNADKSRAFEYPLVAPQDTVYWWVALDGGTPPNYTSYFYHISRPPSGPARVALVESIPLEFCPHNRTDTRPDAEIDRQDATHPLCPPPQKKPTYMHTSWVTCGSGCCHARSTGQDRIPHDSGHPKQPDTGP
jgi:hypothetical protein